MATATTENSYKTNPMAKVFTHGSMAKYTRVNGGTDSRKVKAFGKAFLETPILENGCQAKLMATACTSGKMETDMKENGLTASNMARGLTYSQWVTSIKVNTMKASRTGQEFTNGRILLFIKESSQME